jgi:hypothetical protein
MLRRTQASLHLIRDVVSWTMTLLKEPCFTLVHHSSFSGVAALSSLSNTDYSCHPKPDSVLRTGFQGWGPL